MAYKGKKLRNSLITHYYPKYQAVENSACHEKNLIRLLMKGKHDDLAKVPRTDDINKLSKNVWAIKVHQLNLWKSFCKRKSNTSWRVYEVQGKTATEG